MKLCECGCGTEISEYRARKRDGVRRFVSGHHARVIRACHEQKIYTPTPEETPSGICECGCGKKTELAKATYRQKRHFRGYPLPFCQGHYRKKPRGEHHLWKGGRIINSSGYVALYMPDHPHADTKGYVLEHRYVMAQVIGRWPDRSEHVHHKNENRQDNRIENLELLTAGEHMRLHNLETGRRPPSRLGCRKSV